VLVHDVEFFQQQQRLITSELQLQCVEDEWCEAQLAHRRRLQQVVAPQCEAVVLGERGLPQAQFAAFAVERLGVGLELLVSRLEATGDLAAVLGLPREKLP
jgi:hypothetical protein